MLFWYLLKRVAWEEAVQPDWRQREPNEMRLKCFTEQDRNELSVTVCGRKRKRRTKWVGWKANKQWERAWVRRHSNPYFPQPSSKRLLQRNFTELSLAKQWRSRREKLLKFTCERSSRLRKRERKVAQGATHGSTLAGSRERKTIGNRKWGRLSSSASLYPQFEQIRWLSQLACLSAVRCGRRMRSDTSNNENWTKARLVHWNGEEKQEDRCEIAFISQRASARFSPVVKVEKRREERHRGAWEWKLE